jgi:hypothetical protein
MTLPAYYTTDDPMFWVAISFIFCLCVCLGCTYWRRRVNQNRFAQPLLIIEEDEPPV